MKPDTHRMALLENACYVKKIGIITEFISKILCMRSG
jgi:hypothetical protein